MPSAAALLEALARWDAQHDAMSAPDGDLERTLEALLRTVEASAEHTLYASVLLVDESGEHLLHGAAPSLPKAYCEAIHGIAIGPGVGSCGTAAYLGHPVYVTDIPTDPLWADFKDLAAEHGLRACWSTPVQDETGRIVGTFAIYYPTPRSPTSAEIEAIRSIASRAASAIATSRAA